MSKVELSPELKSLVREMEEFLARYEEYLGKNKSKTEVAGSSKKNFDEKDLAKKIDHTLLKPETTPSEIKKLCDDANEYKFAVVCVNPNYVKYCFDLLKGSGIKVCTVIGFPLGATTTPSKKAEAEEALKDGAVEVDMVINIGRLKAGEYNYVYSDIKAVADAAKKYNGLTKVIIETCLLTDSEKILACLIAKDAGADFVKTSTGFSKSGATVNDVALMKYVVGDCMKVKASGGVRTKEDALAMIENGADRLGTSSGVKIIKNETSTGNY